MRRLLFLGLFGLCVGLASALSRANHYRDVFHSICDLSAAHFYKTSPKFIAWFRDCQSLAAQLPVSTNIDGLLISVQDHLSTLNTSHFSIFSPVEDRKLWKGETVDTGIRSRYIDGHLVIYRVLPASSAARAGVRMGDELVRLPGVEHPSPWGAEHRAGVFGLRRGGADLNISVAPTPLQIDESPSLTDLGGGVGRLEIPSFRGEFFDAGLWRAFNPRLSRFARLIVDLRENAGGNFVAMLRALSVFDCEPRAIGRIVQPRRVGPNKAWLDDVVDDQHQLGLLDHYHAIGLTSFAGYGCYRGGVTVLISSNTASVAEIFADAMRSRPLTRVWGQPSAGDVVLAVWYDLPSLGPGFSLSIPEAVFINTAGLELEGRGVRPQRELYYDLDRSLKGGDSWLEDAQSSTH